MKIIAWVALTMISFPSFAKVVHLSWDPVEDAVSYELSIEKAGQPIRVEQTPSTEWTGSLEEGFHAYRIRAYDSLHRPGAWSDPFPIVVMGAAPTLLQPLNNEKKVLYSGESLRMIWKGSPAYSNYEVEINQGSATILRSKTGKTELSVGQLPSGHYTWTVRGIILPDKEYPGLSAKEWSSKTSEAQGFWVEGQSIEKPVLLNPIGAVWASADGKIDFRWEKTAGAIAYQIRIKEVSGTVVFPEKVLTTEDTSISASVAQAGAYEWSVKPLARLDSKEDLVVVGKDQPPEFATESKAEFHFLSSELNANASIDFGVQTGIDGYRIGSMNTTDNYNGTTSGLGVPISLWIRKWTSSTWGFEARTDAISLLLDNVSQTFLSARMGFINRSYLGSGWASNWGGRGVIRQYPLLSPMYGGESSKLKTEALFGIEGFFEISKFLSQRWQIAFFGSSTYPLKTTNGDQISNPDFTTLLNTNSLGCSFAFAASPKRSYRVGASFDRLNITQNTTNHADQKSTFSNIVVGVAAEFHWGEKN